MMKALLKIKLLSFFKQTLQNKKTKQSKLKTIAMLLLFAYVGVVFLGMFYLLFDTIIEPFHLLNLDWLYFAIMAVMVIMLCFIGSVFLTEHEIYEAKDNELLLAMPITSRDILLCRLFMILILDYVFELLIAVPALIVYYRHMAANLLQILILLIVLFTLPFLVMTLTMIMAWIVAMIMKKLRHKNLIVLVLWLLFFVLYFFGVSKIQSYIMYLVENGTSIARAIEKGLFPVYHLAAAVTDIKPLSLMYYLLTVFVPFAVVLYLLTTNFIRLTTAKPKQKKIKYHEQALKQKNILSSLFVRELKHFLSNPMVILNGVIGSLMIIIASAALIIYQQDVKDFIAQIPFLDKYFVAAACLFSIAMGSLNTISASLVSLEGKNLWILKVLPVQSRDVLMAKLLLHLSMCLPGHIIFGIAASWVFRFGMIDMMIVVMVPNLVTLFVALSGLLLNLWKPRFDWINETVCVKQSLPVFLTMLVAMGMVFGIGYGYIKLFTDYIAINDYVYMICFAFVLIDIALYTLLMRYGVKKWEQIY